MKKLLTYMVFVIAFQPDATAQLSGNPFGTATSGLITLASGTINKYQAITSTVTSASGSSFTTGGSVFPTGSGSFNTGERVLVIQMVGGSGGFVAGTCEWARISGAGTFQSQLINTYSSVNGNKAQIVSVPEYYDLTINGAVTCFPWNGSVGGVLVFNVNHNLTITSSGVCDVTGKGFLTGYIGPAGSAGSGGLFGLGGAINTPGANGANTGTAFLGNAGGGNGAMYGGGATNNTSPQPLGCPGCGLSATNVSNLSVAPKKIIMGGAGQSGNGGSGTAGAGGGGGGGGGLTAPGSNGTSGGMGANGGSGGNGGIGGGIIIFTARNTTLSGGNKFLLNGITLAGSNGTAATNGGNGGNGGIGGGDCTTGGGGGGGRGADGGNGGNGGNGGAGGTLYYIYGAPPVPAISVSNVQVSGSAGGLGGAAGSGGSAGTNGGNLSGTNCASTIPPSSNCHLSESGNCDFLCCLDALYSIWTGGPTPGAYTPPNNTTTCYGTYANGTTNTTVYVEQISSTKVLIRTGNCYIVIEGTVSPLNSIDKIFTAGLHTYSVSTIPPAPGCTGVTTNGTLTDGNLNFWSKCGGPLCGNPGLPGNNGNNGDNGVFSGDPGINCSGFSLGSFHCFPPLDLCSGGIGVGSAIISGGTGPFTASLPSPTVVISGNDVKIDPSISGIITVADANGCTASINVSPCPRIQNICTFNVNYKNVSCYGANDGSITGFGSCTIDDFAAPDGFTVTGINGTNYGPVNHLNGIAITGLMPGTYSVKYTGLSCTPYFSGFGSSTPVPFPINVEIYSPAAPISIASVVTQPTSCNSNGAVNLTVTGGTPDAYQINQFVLPGGGQIPQPPQPPGPTTYTYTWNPALNAGATVTNSGGNYSVTNVAPGTYTVTFKDLYGCTGMLTVIVNNPKPVLQNSSFANETCGNGNGTATANFTGGTLPYSYTWNTTSNQTSTATGLGAGNYIVTVTDANNCSATASFTISNIALPTVATIMGTTTLCAGTTAQLTDATSGGTWSSDNTSIASVSSNGLVTGVAAGSTTIHYSVTNSCGTTTADASITVIALPIVAAITGTASLCAGATAQLASITSGGAWSSDNNLIAAVNSNGLVTGVAAGSTIIHYSVTNSCGTTTVNMGETVINVPTVAAITGTTTLCAGTTAQLTDATSGGTWSSDNVSIASVNSNGLITGVAPGNTIIHYVVTNACGAATADATITIKSIPTVTAVATCTTCGNANGNITVTGAGGTAPYQYSINGSTYQSNNVFGSLAAGSYPVIIKDNNGCLSSSTTVTITNISSSPTLTVTKTNSTCGNANGSITVTGAGGTGPYLYSINGGTNYQSNNTFTGLVAGTYSVTIKDNNGCLTTGSTVTITNTNNKPSLSVTITNATCGNANGKITVIGSGGTSPYQYSINGGTYQPVNVFNGLPAGIYAVTIKDFYGCINTISVVTIINTSNKPSVTLTVASSTCGNANGSITATGSGGTAPYQYSINGGTYQSGNIFTGLPAGTYIVTIKSNNGCENISSPVTINNINNKPSVTATPIDSICGISNGSITVTASGGTAPYQYSIDGIHYQLSNIFNNVPGGIYTVTVKDVNLCTATTSVRIVYTACPPVCDCCAGGIWTSKTIGWNIKKMDLTEGILKTGNADHLVPIGNDPAGPITLPATYINITRCDSNYHLSQNGTYTFNATFQCGTANGQTCSKAIKVKIKGVANSSLDGLYDAPIEKTFTTDGNYQVSYYAYCGDKICDSCNFIVTIDKNCCLGSEWITKTYQIINSKYVPIGSAKVIPLCGTQAIPLISTPNAVNLSLVYACAPGCGTAIYQIKEIVNGISHLITLNPGQTTASIYPASNGLIKRVYIYAMCGGKICPGSTLCFDIKCSGFFCSFLQGKKK